MFYVLSLIFLMSGLMFVVGLMVGVGVGKQFGVRVQLSGSEFEKVAAHDGHGHDEGSSRAPASIVEKTGPVAGAQLRKAFRDSKQAALVEMSLMTAKVDAPKSVMDTRANVAVDQSEGRTPASAHEALPAAPTATAKVGAHGEPPKTVRNLFERSPSATEQFSPASGSFTIQIASYSTLEESSAKVRGLKAGGFAEAYAAPFKTKSGETWYRVAVGSFTSREYAKKIGDRLVKRKLASDFILRKID